MYMEMRWLDYCDKRGRQCRKLQFRETYYDNWRDVPIVLYYSPSDKKSKQHLTIQQE